MTEDYSQTRMRWFLYYGVAGPIRRGEWVCGQIQGRMRRMTSYLTASFEELVSKICA